MPQIFLKMPQSQPRDETASVYREMVCAALDELHRAQVRIVSLEKQLAALRAELQRYVAMRMDEM